MNLADPVFIVGAQRCGTTYLCHALGQHPQITVAQPLRPEPKFFLQESEVAKGRQYYLTKHFSHCAAGTFENGTSPGVATSTTADTSGHSEMIPSTGAPAHVLVEKSTSYIESADAARRIKGMFPGARILISLRNPVERALSNYFFSLNSGLETRRLKEAILGTLPPPPLEFVTSVSPFDYVARGEYVTYLKAYFEVFGREAVKIIIFDRFAGQMAAIQDLYQWIGVEKTFAPRDVEIKINTNNIECEIDDWEIDEEVLQYLSEYYRPHVVELEKCLGGPLAEWHDRGLLPGRISSGIEKTGELKHEISHAQV